MPPYSCGILTVSTKGAHGARKDTSGPNLQAILEEQAFRVTAYEIVADDPDRIRTVLLDWVDNRKIDLIVTTGGTGVAPSDRTPEATRLVIEREVPGIAETMRRESFKKTSHAVLSRGTAGIRKATLLINLPGSKKAAQENLEAVLPALPHAISKIKGGTEDCGG